MTECHWFNIIRYHTTNHHCIGKTLAWKQGHAQVLKRKGIHQQSRVKQFHPIWRLFKYSVDKFYKINFIDCIGSNISAAFSDPLREGRNAKRSQSTKVDIGNQAIQSTSININCPSNRYVTTMYSDNQSRSRISIVMGSPRTQLSRNRRAIMRFSKKYVPEYHVKSPEYLSGNNTQTAVTNMTKQCML